MRERKEGKGKRGRVSGCRWEWGGVTLGTAVLTFLSFLLKLIPRKRDDCVEMKTCPFAAGSSGKWSGLLSLLAMTNASYARAATISSL